MANGGGGKGRGEKVRTDGTPLTNLFSGGAVARDHGLHGRQKAKPQGCGREKTGGRTRENANWGGRPEGRKIGAPFGE